MAVNVIDAFVMKMGWDTSAYKKGAEEISSTAKRTRESLKRGADDIESRNKVVGESFRNVKNEVVGLGLAFAGATGLRDFVSGIITGSASTDRLAGNLGVATKAMFQWELAVRHVGGSAADADSAILGLRKAYNAWKIDGNTEIGAVLGRLGVTDPNDIKDPTRALMKLAHARDHMSAEDFYAFAGRAGINDNMINLLTLGSKKVKELLDLEEKNAEAMKRNAGAAREFQDRMAELSNSIQGTATPAINELLKSFDKFIATKDGMEATKDVALGVLGALGLAALAAAGPWIALAAAIAAIAYAAQHPDEIIKIHGGGKTLSNREKGHRLLEMMDPRTWVNVHQKGGQGEATGTALGGLGFMSGTGGGSTGGSLESFFQRNGYSAAQARGMAAAIHAESGGKHTQYNLRGSGAYGLAQWLSKDRLAAFKARFGHDIYHSTEAEQRQFILHELGGSEAAANARIRGQTTAAGAARAFIEGYERPGAAGIASDMRGAQAYLARGGSGSGGNTVNIGSITVNTKATDAKGIARDIGPAMQGRASVTQANTGMPYQ